jgi:uncharacterized protein (TIGR02646 family)
MRHIQHASNGPDSIRAAYRAEPKPLNPPKAWDCFDKAELREHLWEIQFGLCAYCERVLEPGPGNTTIEHIVPKTANPEVTFQYTNLVLCCTDRNTCNLHKKGAHFAGFHSSGRWSEGFVAPTQSRCEASFVYKGDGSIDPTQTAYIDDTEETIRILNLDCVSLRTQRRDYLGSISTAVVSMIDQPEALVLYLADELSLGSLKPFYSAKRQHFHI